MKEENESERELQETLSIIASRQKAFERSPFWFTVWDALSKAMRYIFWIAFWGMVMQCHCDCLLK